MPNQYINKVQFGDQTIMDITDTSADAQDVLEGEVFYNSAGARTVGALGDATQSTHGLMSAADKQKLDTIIDDTADSTSTTSTWSAAKVAQELAAAVPTSISDLTDDSDFLTNIEFEALIGANSGLATLDSSGKVPSSQLPSYVDDVLEYSDSTNFPATGETSKIYVDTTSNKTYRWGGSEYVEISESLALGETESTAYRGDRGKVAYDHAAAKGSAYASGLYKITTNAEGHVTAAAAVTKTDITGLGIPAQDTTYQSLAAAENGTDVSLVSTGEKYVWNSKASGDHTHLYAGSATVGGAATTVNITQPTKTTSGTAGFINFVSGITGGNAVMAQNSLYLYNLLTDSVLKEVYLNVGAANIGGGITLHTINSNFYGDIRINSLTANRQYNLPDAAGTIALTSSNITGNAATATAIKTAGTTAQFYRGDNSWSNTLAGNLNLNGNLIFTHTTATVNGFITWASGTWYQRIFIQDDSIADTAVFTFQQSSDTGSTYTDLLEIRDNGHLVLSANTGGIYKYYGSASTVPFLQVNSNNLDVSILKIDGNNPTDVRDSYSYGFNLKYIGTGGGAGNTLRLVSDNSGGTDITAMEWSGDGRVGIGAVYNSAYRLYVNGPGYFNNILTLHRESSTTDNAPAGILFSVKDTTTGSSYESSYIYAYQDHGSTSTGLNMVICPAGNLFIGSGESPANLYPTYKASTAENLFITADGTVYMYANAQTIANRIGFAVSTAGAIVPQKAEAANNNAQTLGVSGNAWSNIYATTHTGTTGTFSGTVSAKTFTITSTTAEAHLNFSRAGYNYINIPTSGALGVTVGGQSASNLQFAVEADKVHCYADNHSDLGTATVNWKSVHSKKYVVSENVTLQWNSTDSSLDFVFA